MAVLDLIKRAKPGTNVWTILASHPELIDGNINTGITPPSKAITKDNNSELSTGSTGDGFVISADPNAKIGPSGTSPNLARSSLYKSNIIDIGKAVPAKTMSITKTGNVKALVRAGNTSTIVPSEIVHTSNEDFNTGTLKTNVNIANDAITVSKQKVWTRQNNGDPVLNLGAAGKFDDLHANKPYVLSDGTTYHMWYSGLDGTNYRVGYATSTDRINWTRQNNGDPVLNLGAAGKFDDVHIYGPSVLFDGTTYHMWYSGYDGTNYRVGYATSTDRMNWTKQNNGDPVFNLGAAGKFDSVHIYAPIVLFDGATYHMWYTGDSTSGFTSLKIGYATSTDRVNWTRQNNGDPVLSIGAAGKFDSACVTEPYVLFDGVTYHMWYGGYNGTNHRIGYATSTNKINWTRQNNGDPVLNLGAAGKFDSVRVHGSCVLFDGTTYHTWYSGYNNTDYRIGYAILTDLANYELTAEFHSKVINLTGAYNWDLVSLNSDVPANCGITLSVRTALTETDLSSATWDTPTTFTTSENDQINIHNINQAVATSNQWGQVRLQFTTPGSTEAPIVREIRIFPQAENYSRLKRFDNDLTSVQSINPSRYWQVVGLGASDGSTEWNIDSFGIETLDNVYLDLGCVCKIVGITIQGTAVIEKIEYSNQDVATIGEVTNWTDAGTVTNNAVTFSGGTGIRWIKISKTSNWTDEIREFEVYIRLAKTDTIASLTDTNGTELSSSGTGDDLIYSDTLASHYIGGAASATKTYRIKNNAALNIPDSAIWTIVSTGDGADYVEISSDGITFNSAANSKKGVTIGAIPVGSYKEFFVRINAPSGTPGNKEAYLLAKVTYTS